MIPATLILGVVGGFGVSAYGHSVVAANTLVVMSIPAVCLGAWLAIVGWKYITRNYPEGFSRNVVGGVVAIAAAAAGYFMLVGSLFILNDFTADESESDVVKARVISLTRGTETYRTGRRGMSSRTVIVYHAHLRLLGGKEYGVKEPLSVRISKQRYDRLRKGDTVPVTFTRGVLGIPVYDAP